jgi:hypothetical protein
MNRLGDISRHYNNTVIKLFLSDEQHSSPWVNLNMHEIFKCLNVIVYGIIGQDYIISHPMRFNLKYILIMTLPPF